MTTKCDIIRKGCNLFYESKCDKKKAPVECNIFQIANVNDLYFKEKYNLSDPKTRKLKLNIYGNMVNDLSKPLKKKYGKDAPVDIKWHNFTDCLWNENKYPGGYENSKYISRNDIKIMGYRPDPLIGGKIDQIENSKVINYVVPVVFDKMFNPSISLILILFVILIIIIGLILVFMMPKKQSMDNIIL